MWIDRGLVGESSAIPKGALCWFNGKLYAGGSNADDEARVYRLDGETTWTDISGQLEVPTGYYIEISALCAFGGKLYASVQNEYNGHVWQYDEISWIDCGGPAGRVITSLAVHNNKLYAGELWSRVYEWNGVATWTSIGDTKIYATVEALVSFDGNLYAAGRSGNPSLGYGDIARWGGSTVWTAVGIFSQMPTGSNVEPFSLVEHGGKLHTGVGNQVTSAGQVKRYDDSALVWTTIANFEYQVRSLLSANGELYAGSSYAGHVYRFLSAIKTIATMGTIGDGIPTAISTFGLATGTKTYVGINGDVFSRDYWDSPSWTNNLFPGTGDVKLGLFKYGSLSVICAAGATDGHVYRQSGTTTWVDLGQPGGVGCLPACLSYSTVSTLLYAGDATGGHIWRWSTGTTWIDCGHPAVDGVPCCIGTKEGVPGSLYVGCTNGHVYLYVSGTTWTDLGVVGDGGPVLSLISFGGAIYTGLGAGGTTSGHVFRYTSGTTWVDVGHLGTGTNVYTLGVYEGQLYGGTNGAPETGVLFIFDGASSWVSAGTLPGAQSVRCLDPSTPPTGGGSIYPAWVSANGLFIGTEQSSPAEIFLLFNSGDWEDLGVPGSTTYVENLVATDPETIYAGCGWDTSLGHVYLLAGEEPVTPETSIYNWIGFRFNINQTQVVGVPTLRTNSLASAQTSTGRNFNCQGLNAWNHYDEFGLLTGLTRNAGETNWAFRRRIRDAFVHVANSTYQGLVYGITRELGLTLYDAITIDPIVLPGGSFKAAAPNVVFDGVWLKLYTDYDAGLIELQIDRRSPGGNYETLGRLVDRINQSTYFTAALLSGVTTTTSSMAIFNQSGRQLNSEPVDSTTGFQFQHPFIVENTLYFSDKNVFGTEVAAQSNLLQIGDFYVDYDNGRVYTKSLPGIGGLARYEHIQYPFIVQASPVILHDILGTNFANQLFQQVLQDDGTNANGILRELGTEVVNELLSVRGMYFGK